MIGWFSKGKSVNISDRQRCTYHGHRSHGACVGKQAGIVDERTLLRNYGFVIDEPKAGVMIENALKI